MLHVPHVVEQQFTVTHVAIREGARIPNPGFCHSRHQGVQLFAAVLEVAEQFVFSVGALRRDAPGSEFGETERRWRMESGFFAFREIEVEEEERVKCQVPKRARRLTGPQRIRQASIALPSMSIAAWNCCRIADLQKLIMKAGPLSRVRCERFRHNLTERDVTVKCITFVLL